MDRLKETVRLAKGTVVWVCGREGMKTGLRPQRSTVDIQQQILRALGRLWPLVPSLHRRQRFLAGDVLGLPLAREKATVA